MDLKKHKPKTLAEAHAALLKLRLHLVEDTPVKQAKTHGTVHRPAQTKSDR